MENKTSLAQVNILFFALLVGQVIFAAVAYYVLSRGAGSEQADQPFLQVLVPLLLMVAVFFSWRMVQKVPEGPFADEEAKLGNYRQQVILRSALMEGANLMAVVAAIMTGQMYYLTYFLVGIAAFVFFRPTATEFARKYG